MKKIRIGNDLNITWSVITKEKEPFPLDEKDVTLYMVNPFHQRVALDGVAVTGNSVRWTFYGMDQKHVGKYSLELVLNEYDSGMVTIDTCDFVELVARSCQAGGDAPGDVSVESIELSSELDFYAELKDNLANLSARVEENEVLIEDLQNTKIDRENDDYYPKMAVGVADNLSGVDVVDSEINFRRSGGGAIIDGVARIENIKGNSVVWNNKFDTILTGSTNAKFYELSSEIPNGHVVYLEATCIEKGDTIYISLAESKSNYDAQNGIKITVSEKVQVRLFRIEKNVKFIYIYNPAVKSYTISSIRLHDLTQMFGAGNEPTTIEEFNARKPMGIDEYAYNEGELIHTDVQSMESVGVNQWDEQWELGDISTTNGTNANATTRIRSINYIPVQPTVKYYFSSPASMGIRFYDGNKAFLETKAINPNSEVVIPLSARYIRFVANITSYENDICINISDSSINGKYFPHVKRIDDLSIIRKYFPDGMKSAGAVHDEIRYNKATLKWEKVESIGTRAYQDSDATNVAYLTDSKTTCYPLAEPIITELDAEDQFKDFDYQVWNAGTEKAIAKGMSSALAADITYGFNAVGKIKELEAIVAMLRTKVGV